MKRRVLIASSAIFTVAACGGGAVPAAGPDRASGQSSRSGADHSPGGDLSGTERVSGFLKVKDLPRRATFMQNVLANPASTQGTTPY